MRVAVIGATGRTGSAVVERALASGLEVTAVARDPSRFGPPISVSTIDFTTSAGLGPEADLAIALGGVDAVISTVGPRRRAEAGIVAPATAMIVAAMARTGVRRLEVISAAPVSTIASPGRPDAPDRDPGDDWLTRRLLLPIVRRAFRATYDDLAAMEDLVAASDLDWTVVRPPRLLNRPATGRFRTSTAANIRGGRSVSRADLADYLVAILTDPRTYR